MVRLRGVPKEDERVGREREAGRDLTLALMGRVDQDGPGTFGVLGQCEGARPPAAVEQEQER
jgi:hypothetical protein